MADLHNFLSAYSTCTVDFFSFIFFFNSEFEILIIYFFGTKSSQTNHGRVCAIDCLRIIHTPASSLLRNTARFGWLKGNLTVLFCGYVEVCYYAPTSTTIQPK